MELKSRVKVRERENSDGTNTIRLDYFGGYFNVDGKRVPKRYRRKLDFKLITIPSNPLEKEQNKNYRERAKLIAIDCEREIINEEHGLVDKEKRKQPVIWYINRFINNKHKSGKDAKTYETMRVPFTKLFNKNIYFSSLDVEAYRKWYHYLQNKEKIYRAKSFFNILQ